MDYLKNRGKTLFFHSPIGKKKRLSTPKLKEVRVGVKVRVGIRVKVMVKFVERFR